MTQPARPRGPVGWSVALHHEALARRARRSPAVVAEFADDEVAPKLSRADAAACVLAGCEVLADLHAGGFAGEPEVSFAPAELRVRADGRSISWRIPVRAAPREYAAEVTEDDLDALFGDVIGPIAGDLRQLLRRFPELFSDPSPVTPAQAATLTAIDALFAEADATCLVSAARVAQLVAALTDRPAEWRDRVAALPVVRTLPAISFDWDAIVGEGEAMLAEHARSPYFVGRRQADAGRFIMVPLATAYHQRASRSFARGDAAAALRDIERALALDDYFPLHTTRALVLDALGRHAEARAAAEVAVVGRLGAHRDGMRELDDDRERARAHATRGSFALRDGALALAEADLRRACAHAPDPMYTHTLAAVLHARGDLAGAEALSAEAVAMAPDDARLRWALAVRLDELGRTDEAREHAAHALARAPEQYAARHARRFA